MGWASTPHLGLLCKACRGSAVSGAGPAATGAWQGLRGRARCRGLAGLALGSG